MLRATNYGSGIHSLNVTRKFQPMQCIPKHTRPMDQMALLTALQLWSSTISPLTRVTNIEVTLDMVFPSIVGVPITTRLGHVIGVYTVTDDKPRAGLSPEELRFMADMAIIVVQHLEAIKNDQARGTHRGGHYRRSHSRYLIPPSYPPLTMRKFETNSNRIGTDESSPAVKNNPPEFKGLVIQDANTTPKEFKRIGYEEPGQDQLLDHHGASNELLK
ncbi:uncharacterized protein Z518_06645 [Rhinocladiella mackenziei CBS 650.93]|uniref:GAF domain-containing protein n=1 Tax=Rhinocladiella mackenziei CBS 650.93 TaxID=1442369 RepID=A0A0D2J2G7_9EURO|nr:uncharacterized protein Z518_06645 [Rhinocladiella mackenziei CBS 650.93]KIX03095.1 hypothetical protein Z518_06645 [Rhinocladiella mackenziei CBS 650.93]